MKADERRVKFFDLDIKASVVYRRNSTFVPPLRLEAILTVARALIRQKKIIEISDKNGTEFLHLVEVKITQDKNKAVILINRSDTRAADLAISDRGNNNWRVAKKNKSEGNAYSCHIAFNLKAKNSLYQMVMEDVPGVSVSKVQRLLGVACRLARDAGNLSFFHNSPGNELDENGKVKLLKANYKFDVLAHPSLNFIDELKKGKLEGIELVDTKQAKRGWDAYKATQLKGRFIKLSPVKNSMNDWWRVVQSVVKNAKGENMTEVRVRFTDTNKATHTVKLDPRDGSMINEDHFVKKVTISGFSSRLDTGFKKIHSEIENKILYLIR